MTPNSLALQQLEEALGNRIVVAVSSSAHTPFQAMFPQETLPVVTGVLATLVRMHHHLCFGVPPPYRHQQRIQYQLLGDPGLHGPANHTPGEQVYNHS